MIKVNCFHLDLLRKRVKYVLNIVYPNQIDDQIKNHIKTPFI